MANLKLISPWMNYYREVDAFFRNDNGVRVVFDEDDLDLKIYVDNVNRYTALCEMFPPVKEFGNVTLKISLIPANGMVSALLNDRQKYGVRDVSQAPYDIIEDALRGNPNLKYVRSVVGIGGVLSTYVVFRKRVIQYFTDNIGDIHGVRSTLAEEIAREIFDLPAGVFYCTDIEDEVNTWGG